MKFKIESEDENEIKRLIKASDMADFIIELKNNAWRQFENTNYDYVKSWDVINDLLEKYNITNDIL